MSLCSCPEFIKTKSFQAERPSFVPTLVARANESIAPQRNDTQMNHTFTFALDGTARCLWTEVIPLHELGRLELQRASTIEFHANKQMWEVRLASNPDIVAFSHQSREICLNWERNTLNVLL